VLPSPHANDSTTGIIIFFFFFIIIVPQTSSIALNPPSHPSLQVLQRNKMSGKDACVGSVVRVSSPKIFYNASAGGTSEGGAVFLGWEYR
jgi:hypothetical protein